MFSCEFCEISKNTFLTEHLETASTLVRATNQVFKMFKENRVNAINNLAEPNLWNCCRTDQSPSDSVTRVYKILLKTICVGRDLSFWRKGPYFLKEDSSPQVHTKLGNDDSFTQMFNEEVERYVNLSALNTQGSLIKFLTYENSVYKKLSGVTALILRLIKNFRNIERLLSTFVNVTGYEPFGSPNKGEFFLPAMKRFTTIP